MTLIYLVIVYAVYTALILIANYYINLFSEKEEYTREEIKNIFPHITFCIEKIGSRYSFSTMILCLAISSLIGMLFPLSSSHWFIQSAVLFTIIFFMFPIIKKNIEETRVNSSDSYSDSFANFFAKHTDIISFGFGMGFGSSFMYVWASNKELSFLWFILNIVIISIMLEFTVQKMIKEQ
jgi:hypothetical protein